MSLLAQKNRSPLNQSYIFFPYPLVGKNWHSSIGFTLTNMPEDITEEVQLRVPAGDYHVLRRLPKGFYLDGRISFQVLQNHFSVGGRWSHILNDRFSFSVGDDMGWWFGILDVASFKTKASGWINYPNLSLGYRVRNQMLLTLKAEAMVNLYYHSKVGEQILEDKNSQFVGWSGSLYLEQPLYKKKNFLLGLTFRYTKFFWQTWSLYSTFDRYLFYPEITVGFIL